MIGTTASATEDAVDSRFWFARKEIMSKHPAYGFYTQKTSEEIWKKIFEETTRPFVDQGRIRTLFRLLGSLIFDQFAQFKF